MGRLIQTTPLSKRFGRDWILRNLEFHLEQNELVVLVGPNGVGKTTLLRLLAGLVRPSQGQITRQGAVALLANPPAFHRHLTGEENLAYALRLEGLPAPQPKIAEVMQQVGLPLGKRVASYSSGMRKRLAMGRLILLRPAIWLLDEPEAALDQSGRQLLENLVERYRPHTGIVLATHDRGWLERASRILELSPP